MAENNSQFERSQISTTKYPPLTKVKHQEITSVEEHLKALFEEVQNSDGELNEDLNEKIDRLLNSQDDDVMISKQTLMQLLKVKQQLLSDKEQQMAKLKQQLISQEKLAELGQLSAGLVHELKNPLNFIKNFSELNSELLNEAQEEVVEDETLNQEEKLNELAAILTDLKSNVSKVAQHSERANRILRHILAHSRSEDSEAREVKVHELLDETLELAYHGYRASNKAYFANVHRDLCKATAKLKPENLGRVIINLLNNAFYATNEKKLEGLESYKPTISLTATTDNSDLILKISDNGPGIPKELLDKIFDPFFTTKPVGEGNTGLGLAICRKIICEEHNGEMSVKKNEMGGTTFKIVLFGVLV